MANTITNPNPIVTPVIPSATYDLIYVQSININSQQNGLVRATVTLIPYYLDANNNIVFAPQSYASTYFVSDLMTAATTDTNLSAALSSIFTVVESWMTSLPSYVQRR
jgi:hypothetical protein